jgi:N-acylneuraminate cytidylyltransferase
MNILCIIPARGGSKSIPKKNIKQFCGKPLIYWSILQSKQSKYITRTIVSTDDPNIIDVALEAKCEVPFIRPDNISQDYSTDLEFMTHALQWFANNEPTYKIDLIVQLRPTYPCRNSTLIDQCIEKMLANSDYDSLRTVIENENPPYKMYKIVHNELIPLFYKVNDIMEPYNEPRQLLPKTYWHNGCVDIVKPDTILRKKSMSGDVICPYILDPRDVHDIDTPEQWKEAEKYFTKIYL